MHSGIFKELAAILNKNCLILGLGNPLKGDDGFGSLLAEELEGKIFSKVINAASSPENYLGKIARINPAAIIIVDTADFAAKPGEVKLFKKEELLRINSISTHSISLSLLLDTLKEGRPDLDIVLLAVQPQSLKLGGNLSEPLRKTFDILREKFIEMDVARSGKF